MAKKTPGIASRTTLKAEPKSGVMALIEVPGDVREVFGKARPPVRATRGKYTFRTTVAVDRGKSYVGVRRSHREAGKLAAGKSIRVVLELDDAPRTVTPPKELAGALRKDAKAETRARRVAAAIAMLESR